jgi:predicted small secreted protein
MIRRILATLIMLGMFGTLGTISGCNTIAGAGKDIQSGGEKLHDEATEQQRTM